MDNDNSFSLANDGLISANDNSSCDINRGYGGKYIYLIERKTTNKEEALSEIEFVEVPKEWK